MTKRVSYVQMLEDGLVDAQDESERLDSSLRSVTSQTLKPALPGQRQSERHERQSRAHSLAGSGEIRASTRSPLQLRRASLRRADGNRRHRLDSAGPESPFVSIRGWRRGTGYRADARSPGQYEWRKVC
jgi:hypothetical protein